MRDDAGKNIHKEWKKEAERRQEKERRRKTLNSLRKRVSQMELERNTIT